MDWGCTEVMGASRVIHHMEYAQSARHTKKQGIWILRSQMLGEAPGTRVHRRVRAAVSEWVSVTIHLTSYN